MITGSRRGLPTLFSKAKAFSTQPICDSQSEWLFLQWMREGGDLGLWVTFCLCVPEEQTMSERGIRNRVLSAAIHLFLFPESAWLSGFPISWVSYRWTGKFTQFVIPRAVWYGTSKRIFERWKMQASEWECKMWSRKMSVLHWGPVRLVWAESTSAS